MRALKNILVFVVALFALVVLSFLLSILRKNGVIDTNLSVFISILFALITGVGSVIFIMEND